MSEINFIQTGECFYKCNTCGKLESKEIGLYQKRHKDCKGYKKVIMPIGTRNELREKQVKKENG